MAASFPPAWDCHAHVFGPYDQFPLVDTRVQSPPEAPEADYLAMLDRLGMSHGVLVHPSVYGDDHSLVLHMLSRHPQLRGVMVPLPDTLPSLDGLRERGIRAARFSHRPGLDFPGSPRLADLQRMAPALADAGLHAEMWTSAAGLAASASELAKLPVPLVIDHMGGFDPAAGIDQPGFRELRELLAAGHVWVKLCAYRNLLKTADPDAGRPFHQALLEANPTQVVWGSDWPHLRIDPRPEPEDLLAQMRRWTPDAAMQQRILSDNPQRLYG